jgi:hypothetical protein
MPLTGWTTSLIKVMPFSLIDSEKLTQLTQRS